MDIKEKIEAYSEPIPGTGCWLWTRASARRYGQIRYRGMARPAHRVSYEVFKGEIGPGMCVCHQCDEPLCVNPSHLFLGTHSENISDMHRKGRHKISKRPSSMWPWSKLTMQQACTIRAKLASGVSRRVIAQEFGVSLPTIQSIAANKTYTQQN